MSRNTPREMAHYCVTTTVVARAEHFCRNTLVVLSTRSSIHPCCQAPWSPFMHYPKRPTQCNVLIDTRVVPWIYQCYRRTSPRTRRLLIYGCQNFADALARTRRVNNSTWLTWRRPDDPSKQCAAVTKHYTQRRNPFQRRFNRGTHLVTHPDLHANNKGYCSIGGNQIRAVTININN